MQPEQHGHIHLAGRDFPGPAGGLEGPAANGAGGSPIEQTVSAAALNGNRCGVSGRINLNPQYHPPLLSAPSGQTGVLRCGITTAADPKARADVAGSTGPGTRGSGGS